MNCPKCEREMETGFLQWDAGACITWSGTLLPMGLSYWKKDAEQIQSTSGFGVSAIPAQICRTCKILIGDYSDHD